MTTSKYLKISVATSRHWYRTTGDHPGWNYYPEATRGYVFGDPHLVQLIENNSRIAHSLVFSRSDSPYRDQRGRPYGNLYHVKAQSRVYFPNLRDPDNQDFSLEGEVMDSFVDPGGGYYYDYLKRLDSRHILHAYVHPMGVWTFVGVVWQPRRDFILYELHDNHVVLRTRYWDAGSSYATRLKPFQWDANKTVNELTLNDWLVLANDSPITRGYTGEDEIALATLTPMAEQGIKDLCTLCVANYPDQALGFKAYQSFRIVDAPLLRELIDTATDLSGGVEEALRSPRALARSLKRLKLSDYADSKKLKAIFLNAASGSKRGRKQLSKLLSQPSRVLKAMAGTSLFATFGIKLPASTVKDWLSDSVYRDILEWYGLIGPKDGLPLPKAELTVDEESGQLNYTIPSSSMANKRIQALFGDSALRATEVQTLGGIRCKFAMNLGYTTWDDWRDYINAFYKAGLLLSVTDGWDLLPLSFVVDWVTSAVTNLTNFVDYSANLYRLKMTYVSRSVHFQVPAPLKTSGRSKWVTTVDVYYRWYNDKQPPRVHHTDIYKDERLWFNGSFSWSTLPTAGALLISLL